MTLEEKRKFTVISNDLDIKEAERQKSFDTPPENINYQTNPMYEKLLNFQELQKKKRFTVEDLLKW